MANLSYSDFRNEIAEWAGARYPGAQIMTLMDITGKSEEKLVFNPLMNMSLSDIYKGYKQCSDIDETGKIIELSLTKAAADNLGIRTEDCSVYEKVKGNICLKLMSYADNKNLLNDVPHVRYLDMALSVVYLYTDKNNRSACTPIRNNAVKAWGITQNELMSWAILNTPKLIQPDVFSMSEFVSSPIKDYERYMLSAKKTKFLGAVCITYPNVLADFAEKVGGDVIIIPSSVHELILIKNKGRLFDFSKDRAKIDSMIRDVNNNSNLMEHADLLSDHAYLYERATGQIIY